MILAGATPDWVRPTFFGANLLPFKKADGGIRPIAVGLTLRRLVAKVACRLVTEKCTEVLKSRQMGVGVKSGAEALVHAARRFVGALPSDNILVKLDFTNAFNCIRRDRMLEATAVHLPELLSYVSSVYSLPSSLFFGHYIVESAEGVQQGDPLGPLLYSLTTHSLLQAIKSEFTTGYLDDISIGGEVSSVGADVRQLEQQALQLGLTLNHSKCEVIGLSDTTNRVAWRRLGLSFQEISVQDATLLGPL